MKYPQRGQTILQCRDSRRVEQTGQNWLGSSTLGFSCGALAFSSLTLTSLRGTPFREKSNLESPL